MWRELLFLLVWMWIIAVTGACNDVVILTKYSSCVDDFEKNVSRLKKNEAKCRDTDITALQCIHGVYLVCTDYSSWSYNVQQLIDLKRTKDAFAFACKHTSDIANGVFCKKKHWENDIISCITRMVQTKKQNAEQSHSTDLPDKKLIWIRTCTLSCVRDGMAESCPQAAAVYSRYKNMFVPSECLTADETDTTTKSKITKATAVNSVSVKNTVLFAIIVYFILSNLC